MTRQLEYEQGRGLCARPPAREALSAKRPSRAPQGPPRIPAGDHLQVRRGGLGLSTLRAPGLLDGATHSCPGPHTPVPTGWPYYLSAPPTPATPTAGLCQVTLGPHEGPHGGCPGSCGKRRAWGPGQDNPAHHCGLGTASQHPRGGPRQARRRATQHCLCGRLEARSRLHLPPGTCSPIPPFPRAATLPECGLPAKVARVTSWPPCPHDTTRVTGFLARGGQTLVTPPRLLSCPHLASALF